MGSTEKVVAFIFALLVASAIRNTILADVIDAFVTTDTSGWSPAAAILFNQAIPTLLIAVFLLLPVLAAVDPD